MNKANILLLMVIVNLVGCDSQTKSYDQCLRKELFFQCLKEIPEGPKATVTNDWSEVISQCGSEVAYLAIKYTNQIKPECRA